MLFDLKKQQRFSDVFVGIERDWGGGGGGGGGGVSYSGKYFSNKHSAFLSKKHLSVDVTYLEDIILRTVAWNSF